MEVRVQKENTEVQEEFAVMRLLSIPAHYKEVVPFSGSVIECSELNHTQL